MSSGNPAVIAVLTPIWQRVLQAPIIGAEDNFFHLGGNPSLAAQLFSEIALASGRVLPAEMIYQAPTISALSCLLDHPDQPRLAPAVLLKAGTDAPPVFIAHGMGGAVVEFFGLLNSLQSPHAIYGMQAKGNDGGEEPFDRIEDLTHYYLDAIREVQSCGPYSLIGYSLGGLVMLEVARRLSANKQEVRLLAMLDAYPHPSQLSLGQRMRLTARRVRRFSWTAAETPAIEIGPVMQRVRDSAYLAWTRYQPGFYAGKINFVRAATPTIFPEDPIAVWGELADEIEIETVPGDHHEMLTKHFDVLGSLLSQYLIPPSDVRP